MVVCACKALRVMECVEVHIESVHAPLCYVCSHSAMNDELSIREREREREREFNFITFILLTYIPCGDTSFVLLKRHTLWVMNKCICSEWGIH